MVYVNGSDPGLVTSYCTTHGPADVPTPGRLSAVTDTPGRRLTRPLGDALSRAPARSTIPTTRTPSRSPPAPAAPPAHGPLVSPPPPASEAAVRVPQPPNRRPATRALDTANDKRNAGIRIAPPHQPRPTPTVAEATPPVTALSQPTRRRPPTVNPGQGPSITAVGVGFEPTVTCATTVFKTVPLGRSGNPPVRRPPGAERVQRTGPGRRAGSVVTTWCAAPGQRPGAASALLFRDLQCWGSLSVTG